jgi:adenylate kinase
MVNNIAFIAGVHGVGKTTLCSKLNKSLNIEHYSASAIIKDKLKLIKQKNKIAKNVNNNQPALINTLNNEINADKIILDGHFTLFTKNHEITKISSDVFGAMNINIIVLLICEPSEIIKRLSNRDKHQHPQSKIEELQKEEEKHAEYVSKNLNIPLVKINTNNEFNYEFISKTIKNNLK